MKIKVKITDALTGEVIRDNEVETPEYSHEQMSEFHKKFERKYPNAHINFSWFPKRAKQVVSCPSQLSYEKYQQVESEFLYFI